MVVADFVRGLFDANPAREQAILMATTNVEYVDIDTLLNIPGVVTRQAHPSPIHAPIHTRTRLFDMQIDVIEDMLLDGLQFESRQRPDILAPERVRVYRDEHRDTLIFRLTFEIRDEIRIRETYVTREDTDRDVKIILENICREEHNYSHNYTRAPHPIWMDVPKRELTEEEKFWDVVKKARL